MKLGFWRDRRVLCTGASGIVGGWLTQMLLSAGAHVIALVRDADFRTEFYRSGIYKKVAIVNGSVEDFSTVERAINEHQADTVIHLAAQAIVTSAQRSPLATFETNIRGTYHILDACRLHRDLVQRVIIASSDKAYGDHGTSAYSETSSLAANHPYDVSKACGDLLAQTYAHTYDLPIAIARCGNIYGGGDLNWNRIVPGTIRAFTQGARPQVRSDGTYVRDYLYVKDAAAAYMALAQRVASDQIRGQAFNFSGESPRSVIEVVHMIQRIMGRIDLEPKILNIARNEIPYQVLSTDRARQTLDWQPKYEMEDGLRETIAWYRDFLSVPV